MKALAVFRRCLVQNLRDRFGLALTVLTAPFFVLFYWAVFDDTPQPIDTCIDAPPAMVASLKEDLGESSRLTVSPCDSSREFVVLGRLDEVPDVGPATVTFEGDASHPMFFAAVAQLQLLLDTHIATERGESPRLRAAVEPFGRTDELTPFDLYVPNLLIFALIMLIFSTAMFVAREIERGTLERLRLTRMRSRDYLAGVAASQLVVGSVSIATTFAVALALGFSPGGSVAQASFIAFGGAIACIGVGVLTAGFARTVSRAFVISSFFMFLLVLFSGLVFPIPDLAVFDAIPTVHAARALNDVLLLGQPLRESSREVVFLGVLSALCFLAGGIRFHHVHRSFLQADP